MNAQEIVQIICEVANVLANGVCPIVAPPAVAGPNGPKFGRKVSVATGNGPSLKLKDFLKADAAPAPPAHGDYIKSASAPVYAASENILGNDQYGDCTCAGMMHILNILRANNQAAGAWKEAAREDALALYSRVTTPPFIQLPIGSLNDNGADLQTVLSVVQKNGAYSDGTGKITAYASVDATNKEEVKQALYLFGNLYMGVGLPDAWVNPMPQKSGFTWGVNGSADPNNGHCVIAYGYNDEGVFIDTWGEFGTVTWEALAAYFSAAAGGELYTILGPDWINQATQKSPTGLDAAQLAQYISTIFN